MVKESRESRGALHERTGDVAAKAFVERATTRSERRHAPYAV